MECPQRRRTLQQQLKKGNKQESQNSPEELGQQTLKEQKQEKKNRTEQEKKIINPKLHK